MGVAQLRGLVAVNSFRTALSVIRIGATFSCSADRSQASIGIGGKRGVGGRMYTFGIPSNVVGVWRAAASLVYSSKLHALHASAFVPRL